MATRNEPLLPRAVRGLAARDSRFAAILERQGLPGLWVVGAMVAR